MTLNELIAKANNLGLLTEIQNETPERGQYLIHQRESRNALIEAWQKVDAALTALTDFPHLMVGVTKPSYQGTDATPSPEDIGRMKGKLCNARINLAISLQCDHQWDVEHGRPLADPFADEVKEFSHPALARVAVRAERRVVCAHGGTCLCADDPGDWNEALDLRNHAVMA